MCRGALDAVTVVDTALAGLSIDIEVLEVVVEIDRAGAKVTTKEGGVGGEDGRNVNAALLAQWQSNTSEPLVEVCDDGLFLLVADILKSENAIVSKFVS